MAEQNDALISLTTDIVSAFVQNNTVSPGDLPGLIGSVHSALKNADAPVAETPEAPTRLTAAQVRKSVSDKGLVSFIDGKTYQSLRRHLTTNGMTPEDYRERFGLPNDYPMVAPSYSARRSALAKALGLGQKGRGGKPAKGRGRAKK